MPSWLTTLLLTAGLLIGAAFLIEPVLAIRRRRSAARAAQAAGPAVPLASAPLADPGQTRASDAAGDEARIVLADYDRVVVTHSTQDGAAILQAARLVLPQGPYRELAGRLGMPADWPIVMADYDRVVVTHSTQDGTVYVLRPPGEDPKVILRAARLVLPECSYGELADQLGVPASWPMEHQSGRRDRWPAE